MQEKVFVGLDSSQGNSETRKDTQDNRPGRCSCCSMLRLMLVSGALLQNPNLVKLRRTWSSCVDPGSLVINPQAQVQAPRGRIITLRRCQLVMKAPITRPRK